MNKEVVESSLADWADREAAAEEMIPLLGRLYRKNNVATSIYGREATNQSVIGLLKAHRYVRQIEEEELSVFDTLAILKVLDTLDVSGAYLDIGKLAVDFAKNGGGKSLEDYLKEELKEIVGGFNAQADGASESKDVVLYGFGRIGRLLARIMIEKVGSGSNLRLKGIVVRKGKATNDLQKRASLLRRDSVHGPFNGTIMVDEENEQLIVNGNRIQVIYSAGPDQVDYTQYGINDALVIDNTGIWRDADGLGLHLKSKGASKVILTAPGKGDLKNIVYGINNDAIEASDTILSAASCTTNAITPVLKVINDRYGIDTGHVENGSLLH